MTAEETNKAIDDAARFGTGVLILHGGGSSMTHIDLRDFYKPIMDEPMTNGHEVDSRNINCKITSTPDPVSFDKYKHDMNEL